MRHVGRVVGKPRKQGIEKNKCRDRNKPRWDKCIRIRERDTVKKGQKWKTDLCNIAMISDAINKS